jgi:hypothetical protein
VHASFGPRRLSSATFTCSRAWSACRSRASSPGSSTTRSPGR